MGWGGLMHELIPRLGPLSITTLLNMQVAAACVGYMDSNWALWLVIAMCGISLVGVGITKSAVNVAWVSALEAGDEVLQEEEERAAVSQQDK